MVPYATYALNDAHWKTVGTAITNANTGFVGIRRATALPVETFGVQAPAQTGYGGMYIRTDGSQARPYYGYSAGSESAWTYLDGATDKWHLHHSNVNTVTVEDTGNVGIGTEAPDAPLHVVSTGETFAALKVVGYGDEGAFAADARSPASNGTGVYGRCNSGTVARSVEGESTTGYAGYFSGDVHVNGFLMKGGGSFKIDHPRDPENKYLAHAFVESPDMMNVYNGVTTTGADGEAWIELPEYFGVLNRDFRYQVLALDATQFVRVRVSRKIQDNRFRISTDQPGIEVSWQVTGIRKDPWAEANRIPVDEGKPAELRGRYLNPELYGQPPERAVKTRVVAAGSAHFQAQDS